MTMLRMFRLRRYRVFVIFAVVIVFLVYKFTSTFSGDEHVELGGLDLSSEGKDHYDGIPLAPPKTTLPGATKEKVQEMQTSSVVQKRPSSSAELLVTTIPKTSVTTRTSSAAVANVPTMPPAALPDRKTPPDKVVVEDEEAVDDIHPIAPPGRQELPPLSALTTTVYWEKQIEHFPVPTESIIQLPTGTPATIPKIQHKFNDETPDAKINREKRQLKVKEEFQKAWTGYRKQAWLHDELAPKSGGSRDPFCGWAATLVDSLDTLWIMGLKEEFEEAAKAVELIDFTTSPRNDIPVFETTIRYLGGLLAAYDVSGGAYKNLLAKAVELAEILMGAFDTPNRMPVLFYKWKPAFASQPHRAGQRSNLAELGSLSLEFTRLAQLTKDARYYDAVARVTDALEEYQNRGTKLGNVFPENVDASGCNRSAARHAQQPVAITQDAVLNPVNMDENPEGYKPDVPETVREPRPKKQPVKGDPETIEMDIVPGELEKAHIVGRDKNSKVENSVPTKRELPQEIISNRTTSPRSTNPNSEPVSDFSVAKARIGDSVGDWDCPSQGLDSSTTIGHDKFSMGGGQDSTYEYFPKQYLLLGGREEKYKTMYLKTIEDVRKWMLYRPMVPDNRDILFSGAVTTSGNPEKDLTLQAEVEHLTCFIGGMIGMGAKIFELEGDLELAKKLADGCVWAYESTPSGIMPEGATVIPCESAEHCTWNETAYFHFLDPMADSREAQIKEYDDNKLKLAEEAAELVKQTEINAEEQKKQAVEGEASPKAIEPGETSSTVDTTKSHDDENARSIKSEPRPSNDPLPLQRRDSSPIEELAEQPHDKKSYANELELGGIASGRQAEVPLAEAATPTVKEVLVDPLRPLSHKEFVEARIKQASLPPGFIGIRGRKYILRPEAIESVWYMYRITGDPTWQDKGWKMFESIISATSTTYGHSAINDVLSKDSPIQVDEMESFWLAETLKYFYLLYSTPDIISLDDWVLNTEAHPFKRAP